MTWSDMAVASCASGRADFLARPEGHIDEETRIRSHGVRLGFGDCWLWKFERGGAIPVQLAFINAQPDALVHTSTYANAYSNARWTS